MNKIRVTIWNEFRHEKTSEKAKAMYPEGIHACIGKYLSQYPEIQVTLAALDDPDHGLPDSVLDSTDVLIWWGHMHHKEVDDALVTKIQNRVYMGKMGFIALHSSHKSKPFRAIVGTSGNLTWGREQKEIMWNLMPTHPIAAGIPQKFFIEEEELYAEPFFVPQPTELIFGGWYEDGYIFRSGMTFIRDQGKVFYFQPGHETAPSFHNPYVLRIIYNAVKWAVPAEEACGYDNLCPHVVENYDSLSEEKKAGYKLARPAKKEIGYPEDK